jgi:hypothetical protein
MIGNLSTKHKAWNLLIAAVLLLPSAWLLVQFPDLPRFGQLHDDSLYFVSAQSLAQGDGYSIPSLPGTPAQTKYPPLYPLLLSIAWRVTPEFPANLPIAGWFSWLALPAILLQLPALFARWGFSFSRGTALLALFALNSYVILFSTQLLSELWFLAFVLAAIAALERCLTGESAKWAVLAGVGAGLAYLTRSAGIALFAAGALYLWTHKQRRLAVIFCATAAPFAIAWMAWAKSNQTPTNDPELIYYLDYFRYELYAITWSDLPMVLWKNVDGLLAGLGGMVLPKLTGSLFEKILAQVLAVAMISGVVRLFRRGRGILFGWFAAFSVLLLLVWHFPPNERFVLPLFPLALAGLLLEGEHFAHLLRSGRQHRDRSQRVVAGGMTGFAALFAVALVALQAYVGAVYLPEDARNHRAEKAERAGAYQWLAANTPQDAAVLSADDGLLYLYTGRKAMRRPVPPFLWYREDHAGTVAWLGQPEQYARAHGLRYFDFAGIDVSLGVGDEDSAVITKKLSASEELESLHQRGKVTLYAIRPQPASAELRTEPPPPAQ